MINYKIKKSFLKGKLTIPPSKSQTLRAILFASMGHGDSRITHYLQSPDSEAMIEACRSLGANIEVRNESLNIRGIKGKIHDADNVIDAGNSGIVLRFITGIAALGQKPIVITGDHSIRNQRPMRPLLEGLRQLNVSAVSTRDNNFAPIIVQGPLKGGVATIDGEDSQPVSALLIAGAFAEKPLEIHVKNPGEKPWVALTLNWLDRLKIKYDQVDFERYKVYGGAAYNGFEYKVPGDFSSAAFPMAAALMTNSDLILSNLDLNDSQGDKKLIDVLQTMGANISIEGNDICIKKGGRLKGREIDINDFIDSITILSVLGCFAEGKTVIKNAAVARQKECDRIHCMAKELRKMGAQVEEHEDGLTIFQSHLKGAEVYSHEDQRMAMSLAVAGMAAEGETVVRSVQCGDKTFPSFYSDFSALGANIEVMR